MITRRVYSGKLVDIREPEVDVRDMFHSQATTNRYAGACRVPYPVADHGVCLSWYLAGTGFEYEALMHDAAETYTGDMHGRLKADLPDWQAFESGVEHHVNPVIGIPPVKSALVDYADKKIRNDEESALFPIEPVPGLGVKIVPSEHWREARAQMVLRFLELAPLQVLLKFGCLPLAAAVRSY